uniref:Protein TIC 214 n=1 Tax=Roya obtusa TaxID=104537 RepID=A0A191T6G5_9VIRI|nr:hypothetical chloroplast RF1 [Roya obtusa]ANI25989.1 hypothetical chloroplast RF1 [Roya obtusa]
MNQPSLGLLFIGNYCGFLATLPLGPAQLLCIRTFLLEAREKERETPAGLFLNPIAIAGISGLIVGQLIIFLSIFFPSLYSLWVQPHAFSILTLPCILFYWNRIKTFEPNTHVITKESLKDPRIHAAFIETLFFQLLNPILLPNPVYSRLMGVFLFRYSNIAIFMFGNILGYLAGHILFLSCSSFLLKRLEEDTPTIYRLVKRGLSRVFPPIMFAFFLAYLGRTPVAFLSNKFTYNRNTQYQKIWPDIAFDHEILNSPLRLIRNNSLNKKIRLFNKKHFSQNFFETSLIQGKQRLLHNFPQSLSVVQKDISNLLELQSLTQGNEDLFYLQWGKEKDNRKENLRRIFKNRLRALDQGFRFEDIIEKKNSSVISNGEILRKGHDPRLGQNLRGKQLSLEMYSPALLTDYDLKEITSPLKNIDRKRVETFDKKNNLKTWLSDNWQDISNLTILPWEPLQLDPSDYLLDMFLTYSNNPEDIAEENLTWERLLNNYPLPIQTKEIIKKNNLLPWNNIFKQFEISIQKLFNNNNLLSYDSNIKEKTIYPNDNVLCLLDMYKPMPFANLDIDEELFQSMRQKSKRYKFKKIIPYRLTGSMHSRRRKGLTWKTFQTKLQNPLFLHTKELFQEINNLVQLDGSFMISQDNRKILPDVSDKATILKQRWDFAFAHFLRGWSLVAQAYFRRYIKLPVFIILKNLTRSLLLQSSEWQQDWREWAQEVYIDCDYDGNDISVGVNRPTFTGKQIKILYPFHIKPWHLSNERKSVSLATSFIEEANTFYTSSQNHNTLENYSYLTIWGEETVSPFGDIKPKPAFWKPIFRGINLLLKQKIFKQLSAYFEYIFGQTQTKDANLGTTYKYIKTISDKFYEIEKQILTLLHLSSDKNNSTYISIKPNNILETDLVEKKQEDIRQISINKKNQDQSKTNFIQSLENTSVLSINPPNSPSDNNTQENASRFEDLNANNLTKTENIAISNNEILTEKNLEISIGKENLDNNIYTRNNLNLTNKKIVPRNRQMTFQHRLIEVNKKWIYLQRRIAHLQKRVIHNIKQQIINIERKIIQIIFNIVKLATNSLIHLFKIIENIYEKLNKSLNWFVFEINTLGTKHENKTFLNQYQKVNYGNENTYNTKNLSQAYIIHKLWEARKTTTPDLNSLMELWNQDNLLKEPYQKYLYKQGILGNNTPENLTFNQWNEWLKTLPSYTPSYKVWNQITPQSWSQLVTQYWKKHDNVILPFYSEKHLINLENNSYSEYLSYHKPLFDRAQKAAKLWKFNVLLRNYTDYNNEKHIKNLDGWNPKNHKNSIQARIKNIRFTTPIETTQEIDNSIKQNTQFDLENSLHYPNLFTSFPINEEISSNKNFLFKNIAKDFPINKREEKRLNSNLELETISQRMNFLPIYQDRLKSRGKFRNLMKIAIQSKVLQESMLDKKGVVKMSNKIHKDLLRFYEGLQYEDDLFISVLEDWRYRVLDDELLMYNVISSLLRFKNRVNNNLNIEIHEKSSNSEIFNKNLLSTEFMTGEELLLPQSLREFRILEHLNVKSSIFEHNEGNVIPNSNNKTSLNLSQKISNVSLPNKTFKYNDIEIIRRFLWPTHRLEDLACMNRFWIGTANQSRFSMLRIREIPQHLN